MMRESSSPKSPSDDERIGDVWWFADTYRFFIEGLKGLRDYLDSFGQIKNSFKIGESDYDRLLDRLSGMVEWSEKRLETVHHEHDEITVRGITYGSLRLLKAGGLYRVHMMQKQRDEMLAENPTIPRTLLSAIDEQIAQWRDKLEQGRMNGVEPADLFYEATDARPRRAEMHEELNDTIAEQSEIVEVSHKRSPIPPYLEHIPVLDEVLRKRCLPLIAAIDLNQEDNNSTEEQAVQFDTIVREMSVVLEDRIRKLAILDGEKLEGIDLMSRAFAGSTPLIRLSMQSAAQEAAHLLYRGYSGFVRNEVMHTLVPTYTRERVLQLLGLVDYLLFLLTQAIRPAEKSTPPNATEASKP